MTSPFFIICSGRSGSTLLAGMLNMHSQIHIPVELGGLYSTLPRRLKRYGDLSVDFNRQLLANDIKNLGHLRDFDEIFDHAYFLHGLPRRDVTLRVVIETFYDTLLTPTDKAQLGDKTPDHMPHFDMINALFPEALVIHLVRDGRDCALSSMAWRTGINFRNTYELASGWARHNAKTAWFGRYAPDRYLRVHYEDLIQNPSEALSSITSFLGYSYEPQMLEYHTGHFVRQNADRLGHHNNLTRELISGNHGKWQTQMEHTHLTVYESIAGQTLSAFGYPLASSGPGLRSRCLRRVWQVTTGFRRLARRLRHYRIEADFALAAMIKRRFGILRLRDAVSSLCARNT